MKKILFSILLFLFASSKEMSQYLTESFNESSYFTTWATAIISTAAPNIPLSNNSLRQIVHISASGEYLRLKLSNKLGKTNLEIKEIIISDSVAQGTGEINVNTLTPVTFKGENGIIIPSGEEIYSDTVSYNLKSLSDLAISFYFGETPERISGHTNSKTYSFIEEGNKINEQTFSNENKIDHWYFISAIEVVSNPPKKTIVCFGDSITDGAGADIDKNNKWPDFLSLKLHLNKETSDIAVVNKGINGNKITTQGIERYSYDVLDIKGVTYIMVLYGVNDINLLNATSSDVISAYKQIIKQAHENNIFIFAGTILPYGNFFRWTEERENYRQEVNKWIRNTKPEEGGFDAVFDYDELLKDPNDETKLLKIYDSGDGIHPNSEGNSKIVQSIDNLELFTKNPNFNDETKDKEIKLIDIIGVKFKLNFEIKKDEEINVKITGNCIGSKGFRILANKEDEKSSEYYYTGKIEKGKFEISIKLKVYEDSNYIVIRRPISTINIDNIILDSIEVSFEDKNQMFTSVDECIFIK